LQVVDGSWVVRQAVGSTPFIVGRKLTTTYYRTPKYLEVTVDIQSNATAASITGYVAGALKSLSIALGFVLEGQVSEHLPEQLLGDSPQHTCLALAGCCCKRVCCLCYLI
jgi:Protein ENHANCED DISEASE RESISTANCE 2, C-terminal